MYVRLCNTSSVSLSLAQSVKFYLAVEGDLLIETEKLITNLLQLKLTNYILGICWEESVWENLTHRSASKNLKKYIKTLKENQNSHRLKRTGYKKTQKST